MKTAPVQTTVPPLALRDVTKRYDSGGGGEVTALANVDFAVASGEVVAVVGPSGSGKSTMLNILGLLDEPTSGSVELRGEPTVGLTEAERTDARRESLGFVFQDFHLLPTLTAVENVRLPTAFLPEDATERARSLLELVGLGDRLDHTILEEVRRIADEAGVGVVAVTHDDLVTEYADRTVELVDGVLRDV